MALEPCPNCGRKISDRATTCPRCGHPLDEETWETARRVRDRWRQGCAVAVFALLVAVGVLALIGDRL